jgi:hypothetical protein
VSLGYQASPSVVLSALLLIDKPWFLTEGKDLPVCSSYFPLGVSQLSGHNHHQLHASHHLATAADNLYMAPYLGCSFAPAATWKLHTTQPKYFAPTYSEVVNLTGLL